MKFRLHGMILGKSEDIQKDLLCVFFFFLRGKGGRVCLFLIFLLVCRHCLPQNAKTDDILAKGA